jgi:hypothetical protein
LEAERGVRFFIATDRSMTSIHTGVAYCRTVMRLFMVVFSRP